MQALMTAVKCIHFICHLLVFNGKPTLFTRHNDPVKQTSYDSCYILQTVQLVSAQYCIFLYLNKSYPPTLPTHKNISNSY